MKVLKFGGSSVADASRMMRSIAIALSAMSEEPVIMVCSAISGCTDSLVAIGNTPGDERERLIAPLRSRHLEIIRELLCDKARDAAIQECEELFEEIATAPGDMCPVYGEMLSTRIIWRKCLSDGIDAAWFDSRLLVVRDNELETFSRIKAACSGCNSSLIVAPGFIAGDAYGRPTTLGRGGSDYSAALYAVGSGAQTLEIWTDVPGIMTANPKDIEAARTIPEISYEAAWTMAECGAAVLYPPTVRPAEQAGVPVFIKNSFSPSQEGTRIGELKASGKAVGVTRLGDVVYAVFDSSAAASAAAPSIIRELNQNGIEVLDSECSGLSVGVRTKNRGEALKLMHKMLFEI